MCQEDEAGEKARAHVHLEVILSWHFLTWQAPYLGWATSHTLCTSTNPNMQTSMQRCCTPIAGIMWVGALTRCGADTH
jgi:hypothetical protein